MHSQTCSDVRLRIQSVSLCIVNTCCAIVRTAQAYCLFAFSLTLMQLKSQCVHRQRSCFSHNRKWTQFTRQLPQHRIRTRHSFDTSCSIKARWCIDIKYGVKMEAIALLQEWVQAIGSRAGLDSSNSSILSGAVGVPESRLELEVTMGSLSELESFWQQIPQQEHKAWSQRAQHFLIDGSPQWDIYRTVPVALEPASSLQPATAIPQPAATDSSAVLLSVDAQDATSMGILRDAYVPIEETKEEPSGLDLQNKNVILDWKGEPMKINPGDKLPFNFN